MQQFVFFLPHDTDRKGQPDDDSLERWMEDGR